MSELPFEIPTNRAELVKLFLESRAALALQWAGLSEEEMTRRPGPQPEWSVKDMIGHICWWESFALARILVIAAGQAVALINDYDALNQQVEAYVRDLPLEAVLAQFAANEALILGMIERYTFAEWTDSESPNYEGFTLMRLLGGNTFGHYYEHIPDLEAYREQL